MALPLFLMAAGMGLSMAGKGMDIYSQTRAYRQQAKIFEENAAYAEANTRLELEQFNRQAEQFQSSQRAGYAKAGVELSSGSPLEVLADTAGQLELDRQIIRYRGDVEKAGWLNQARMTRHNAKTALISGILGMGGSLISSSANLALSGKSYLGGRTATNPKPPVHVGAGGTTAFRM